MNMRSIWSKVFRFVQRSNGWYCKLLFDRMKLKLKLQTKKAATAAARRILFGDGTKQNENNTFSGGKLNNKHIRIRNKLFLSLYRFFSMSRCLIAIDRVKGKYSRHQAIDKKKKPFEHFRSFIFGIGFWLGQSASSIIVFIFKSKILFITKYTPIVEEKNGWCCVFWVFCLMNAIRFGEAWNGAKKREWERGRVHWAIWTEDTFVIISKPLARDRWIEMSLCISVCAAATEYDFLCCNVTKSSIAVFGGIWFLWAWLSSSLSLSPTRSHFVLFDVLKPNEFGRIS